MSSRRFPGKMLAPFRGRPVLDHVIEAVRRGAPGAPLVVLTSEQPADDPLAIYAQSRGAEVFRGALDDVLGRFRRALDAVDARADQPTDWVLRICGDSPLLSGAVIRRVIETTTTAPDADLITTTQQRTFPRGQNPELLRASTLRRLDDDPTLNLENREHVTHAMHVSPEGYRIVNVSSGDPTLASRRHAIDTIDDLLRLEAADLEAELAGVGR